MIIALIISIFVMWYETNNIDLISNVLVKRNMLSLYISSSMICSLYFYYQGFCYKINKVHTIDNIIYFLKLSLIPIVFLLVLIFDIVNFNKIHYFLIYMYVIITWLLLVYSSIFIAIVPILSTAILYGCNANLSTYEFLYFLYVIFFF